MDGSKNKYLKDDGKSKSSKSYTMDKKLVGSSVDLNLGQTSQDFCGASTATCAGEVPGSHEYMNVLLDSYHGDKKAMVSDLVKTIGDLEEQVKQRKKRALETLIRAENLVHETRKELNMLRMEIDKRKREKENKDAENSCNLKLKEMQQSVEAAWTEACLRIDKCKRLECENTTHKAKIEAFMQNLAESKKELKKAKNREKRKLRKAKTDEKQNRALEAQCDAEEQKVQQLQLDLSQVEKDAKEAETNWRQALHEKEQMITVLSEERKKLEIHRASSRAKLSQLHQTSEIDRQQAEGELGRLKTDFSCMELSLRVGDMMLYDSPEAVAFTARAFQESSEE